MNKGRGFRKTSEGVKILRSNSLMIIKTRLQSGFCFFMLDSKFTAHGINLGVLSHCCVTTASRNQVYCLKFTHVNLETRKSCFVSPIESAYANNVFNYRLTEHLALFLWPARDSYMKRKLSTYKN